MKRILFVDDEPESLRRLSAPFRSRGAEWELAFVRTAEEALRALFQEAFDVVVSDLSLPGMDGGEFLTTVMQRHPSAVRILLADGSDRDTTLRLTGAAHRDLPKTGDPVPRSSAARSSRPSPCVNCSLRRSRCAKRPTRRPWTSSF